MPPADVDVTVELVRSLLADQHPDLADLAISEVANGWDNVIYRLGDEMVVRMPRRQVAAQLIESEQRWLPSLAEHLPIATPAPIRVGRPALGYPWPWSVNPWFDGDVAARSVLIAPTVEAHRLGGFLRALHVAAPDDAPTNAYRGHFVGRNTPVFLERLEQLADGLEPLVAGGAAVVRKRWTELVDVAPFAVAPRWLHGDLHSANVIVDDGCIIAVVDFGDICAGDPATDLAIAWMLFGPADREVFRSAAGGADGEVDDAMWQRGEAWALHFAIIYLLQSGDNPLMQSIGKRLIAALV